MHIQLTAVSAICCSLALLLASCVTPKQQIEQQTTEKATPQEATAKPKSNTATQEKQHTTTEAASLAAKYPAGFVVPLESNPTTGFSWACDVANVAVAELIDSIYKQDSASQGIDGAGGIEYFVFTCKQPGTTGVTFTYRRPWKGGETAEVRRAQLIVDDTLAAKITFF